MRLSLHMMVKNGARTLDRAIRPLAGAVNELCFVDTGSTDGTPEKIHELGKELGFSVLGRRMSPETSPGDYFSDETASYKRYHLVGLCSGVKLLTNWSKARNLALALCSGKYVMKLDADDESMDPANVEPTLSFLDNRPDLDIVMSAYEVMLSADPPEIEYTTMYSRLWRNRPGIHFREVLHENVDHQRRVDGSNWIMAPSGLLFRDWRDSPGSGVRPPNRNFKILLREYERCEAAGSRPSLHVLLYLAEESISISPMFAFEVLSQVRDPSPDNRAWMHMISGMCHAKLGQAEAAMESYGKAAALGHLRAALRAAIVKGVLDLPGWREELAGAMATSAQKFYPFGASRFELKVAESLMKLDDVARIRATNML